MEIFKVRVLYPPEYCKNPDVFREGMTPLQLHLKYKGFRMETSSTEVFILDRRPAFT